MTAANEEAFGTAGKHTTGPQQFLTTMFHVATGLIWDYRRGNARSSKRMRCDAPANAARELDWAMIGLWMLGLLSVSRIIGAGGSPYQWSVASSLRVVRRASRAATSRPRRQRELSLTEALAAARQDGYARNGRKKSRHWPHKKREKPPGTPPARKATELEIEFAA